MKLPPLLPRAEVQARLQAIFPDGRSYCTRDIAGATVFTLLYVGAVEGTDRFLGPKHVYKMSDDQASLTSDAERLSYGSECSKARFTSRGPQWYADNTREPIRDETLRQGLIPVGAVVERPEVPTTSPSPRYSLTKDFASLFDPKLTGTKLQKAIDAWQAANLSAAGLARITVVQAGRTKNRNVSLTLPNGETRKLKPGPSAVITRHVVEVFAERFLEQPALIWVSESGKKVFESDNELATSLNLRIDVARNLPDVILADVAHNDFLLVFVEVVATDGSITETRRERLLERAQSAGIPESRTAFVTAYLTRNEPSLKRNFADLAWNSFVWIASEPENIIAMYAGGMNPPRLHALLQSKRHIRRVK
jgi:hypothetical protein